MYFPAMPDDPAFSFGALVGLSIILYGCEVYLGSTFNPTFIRFGIPVFRGTFNLLTKPQRFPPGHSMSRNGALFYFPRAGKVYCWPVGGGRDTPMKLQGAPVRAIATILPDNQLRITAVAPVMLPLLFLFIFLDFYAGRAGDTFDDILYAAVPLFMMAPFFWFYRYRARTLAETLIEVLQAEPEVQRADSELTVGGFARRGRWRKIGIGRWSIRLDPRLPIAVFAFVLWNGVQRVNDALRPYGLDPVPMEGSLVAEGIVVRAGEVINSAKKKADGWSVLYEFTLRGKTYSGSTTCDCRELAQYRAGGLIRVRYTISDPSVNLPDIRSFQPEEQRSDLWLGSGVTLTALAGLVYSYRRYRKERDAEG